MPAERYHFQGCSSIPTLNQPYPFQGCRPLPQWMIVVWRVVVVKDRLYILQRRLLDPDCRFLGIRPRARGNTGPSAWGPIIYPRMKMKSTVTGTTPSPGQ